MRFQGLSPVLSTPDAVIWITRAAAGKSGQEKENELYLLLRTWILIGGAADDGLACVILWKFKVDPFQATMDPNCIYTQRISRISIRNHTQRMIGLNSELKCYFSPTVVYKGTVDLKYHILK